MKTVILIPIFLLFFLPCQAQDGITGKWKMPENNTKIEITKVNDVCNGRVIQSDTEEALGKVVLKDFERSGEIWKGKFYVVRKDRLFNATLKPDGDQLEMEVKAGIKSKTIMLSRVE